MQDIALELGEYGRVSAPVVTNIIHTPLRHIQMGLVNGAGLSYVSI
jgi:hypothetical protein